jgi:phage regulator Rha-like protein
MEANISSFFINLFIEEKSNEFITIFFGVIPFNDKKIYIYLLMQAGLQIISMQIRSKKGRTISFQ